MKNADFKNKIFQLKISVEGTEPLVWRRVEVSATMSLRGLHRLIQGVFFWKNYHLYVYEVDGVEYGDPELEEGEFGWCNDQSKKLFQIYKKNNHFKYTYDFGDNWIHLIEFEKLLTPEAGIKYPIWTEGEYGPIDEDCGGVRRHNKYNKQKKNSHELPVPRFFQQFNKDQINEIRIERRKVLLEKPTS